MDFFFFILGAAIGFLIGLFFGWNYARRVFLEFFLEERQKRKVLPEFDYLRFREQYLKKVKKGCEVKP